MQVDSRLEKILSHLQEVIDFRNITPSNHQAIIKFLNSVRKNTVPMRPKQAIMIALQTLRYSKMKTILERAIDRTDIYNRMDIKDRHSNYKTVLALGMSGEAVPNGAEALGEVEIILSVTNKNVRLKLHNPNSGEVVTVFNTANEGGYDFELANFLLTDAFKFPFSRCPEDLKDMFINQYIKEGRVNESYPNMKIGDVMFIQKGRGYPDMVWFSYGVGSGTTTALLDDWRNGFTNHPKAQTNSSGFIEDFKTWSKKQKSLKYHKKENGYSELYKIGVYPATSGMESTDGWNSAMARFDIYAKSINTWDNKFVHIPDNKIIKPIQYAWVVYTHTYGYDFVHIFRTKKEAMYWLSGRG